MARPDPTSSWGVGGVNSLPSLGSAHGLQGRVWGRLLLPPLRCQMYLVQEWGVHPTHRAGLEGGQEDTSGMEGPAEGVKGGARIPARFCAAHGTEGEPHHRGPCEGTGQEPQPCNEHRLHCLEHRMPQDRLGAGCPGRTWGAQAPPPGPGDPCPVSGPVASRWWGQGPKQEHTGLTAGPETSPRAPSRPCGSPHAGPPRLGPSPHSPWENLLPSTSPHTAHPRPCLHRAQDTST